MPKLMIKKDDLLIKKISVPEDILAFTVGAEPGNDIIIEDESVSYFHLQFEKQDGNYYVRDLQSQWGTFVNGRRITSRTIVQNNDEIGVGTHIIVFLLPNNNTESSLIAEKYKSEPAAAALKIEEKISGAPTLDKLNSWIHNEDSAIEQKGDFFVEPETHPNSTNQNEFQGIIHEDSHFNVPEQKIEDESQSFNNYIPANDSPAKDSLLNFGFDTLADKNESSSEYSFDNESITPISEIEKNARSEADNYLLLGIYGYYLGRKYKLNHSDTRIGRDRKLNDIIIKKNSKGKIDQSVSRRQATISFKNNQFIVSDKRSKSRTFVNHKKLAVDDEIKINPNDEIEILSDRKSHIFRFVHKDNLDFSFPHKAGSWHIRNRIKLLNIYSVLLFLISLFVVAKSYTTQNKISHRPAPLTVQEKIWFAGAFDSNKLAEAGNNAFTYPAIADMNGDKIIDLIYIDASGTLNCINGKTGDLLWFNNDFESAANIPIMIEDLNKNFNPDVIVVSKDMRIRALDGNWGIEIWKSPILAGPLTGPPIVGDFDGDGLQDLAITSHENVVYIGYSSLKNSRWIKIDVETEILSIASAGDLARDGVDRILIGTETGRILIIDGIQEKVTGEIDIGEEISKASGSYFQNNNIRHPVALGDLTGDAIEDLTVTTMQGNMITLDGRNLKRLWYDIENKNVRVNQSSNYNFALGDLDSDNLLDIVCKTPDGRLRSFKGSGQGKDRKMILWEIPSVNSEYFVGNPVLADFNKNGTMDVVISNNIGNIFIIEGATGEILWHNKQIKHTIISSPLVGDLDNDNYLDILVLKSDGNFYKLITNSLILDNTVVWGQMYGNSKHTSCSLYHEQNVLKFYAFMMLSILVILSIISLHIYFRKKRIKLSEI